MEGQQLLGIFMFLILTCTLIVIIIMTVKRLNSSDTNGTVIIDKPVQMEPDMNTCSGILPVSGNEHTYSFWMFVTHWSNKVDNPKFIFSYIKKLSN